MSTLLQSCYALVVCGGKSSRMGVDKSRLIYHEKEQRYFMHDLLVPYVEDVFISCNETQIPGIDPAYKILPDDGKYRNSGPMAALLSAWGKYPAKDMVLTGCDYPFLSRQELQSFFEKITPGQPLAFYNEQAGLYEPLLAYYPAALSKIVFEMQASGNLSLQQLLKELQSEKYIPQDLASIRSVDSIEQYGQAKKDLSSKNSMKNNSSMPVIIKKISAGKIVETEDMLAVEEPLEIVLEISSSTGQLKKSIAVTMRTPGADRPLAAGFLFTEGIINSEAEIKSIPASRDENKIVVQLQEGINPSLKKTERNFYTTSSCGVCGKASIDAISVEMIYKMEAMQLSVAASTIHLLPAKLRQQQLLFETTGGLHASALFTATGDFISLQEDVGRHNALDKLIGEQLLQKSLPLSNAILVLSGRASFELIQKAARAGIAIVAAVGAPSSLAVELAAAFGITLIGFLKEDRMNVYSHPQRMVV